MIFLDELKDVKLYKKPFHLPISYDDKRKGSLIYLLTNDYDESIKIMNHKLIINNNYFKSYYIEKDITYFINENGYIINEDNENTKDNFYGFINNNINDYCVECKIDDNNIVSTFSGFSDIVNESSNMNSGLRRILYKERYKNNKEVFSIYNKIKDEVPYITKTFVDYNKYNLSNLFIDLSYYNKTFFNNNMYKLDKGINIYYEFINRCINDKRFDDIGYSKKMVFIPVLDKNIEHKYEKDINIISMVLRLIRTDKTKLIKWKDIDFLFLGNEGYFKINFSNIGLKDIPRILININKLSKCETIEDLDINKESKKSIVANVVSKIEDDKNIKINNLTGKSNNVDQNELIEKINDASKHSMDSEETIDKLDDSAKEILMKVIANDDNSVNITKARTARMNTLNDKFLSNELNGVTFRDMLKQEEDDKELPVTKLEVDSPNKEWENLQYINFESNYNIKEDIINILLFFNRENKSARVGVVNFEIEDTSTTEDLIETVTVQLEDLNGQRFTIKFDIPKFKDNKFMKLRGNDKTINGQLTQIPICKTDEDTVQIVSNYKKIFISRFGTTTGKSYPVADKIIKTLEKQDFNNIKIVRGFNGKICSKYDLPIDYIDLATVYTEIDCGDTIYYFNQDDIRNLYKIDESKGIPYGYSKTKNEVLYYTGGIFSKLLKMDLISANNDFLKIYEKTNQSSKYTYSKVSILNSSIPLIVIMGYNEGLIKSLNKANIEYTLSEKRNNSLLQDDTYGVIKFKDGYLYYRLDYNSCLLMNGLLECDTENYLIEDMNSKHMWLDFLENYSSRIIADGLDNFYELMIDPITENVLKYYKLPTDYIEVLAYANNLLQDNKFFKHGDLNARRYRSNEIVAGYIYQCLANSYGKYKTDIKKNKKGTMTMKRTEVIDAILLDPTASDSSILNGLLEIESINAVTYKGLVGMNSDRAYSLDKRTYDKSMTNVLGMATGFAGNVGITRQTTMDMNIKGKRGYIKVDENTDNMSITKTFTATEALTPFGSRHDDPFRSAMTFIQTAKHGMRVKNSTPCLISNGADQALPYMITNTFAFKAKDDGKVIDKTDDYMIVEYKDGNKDYIDLKERVVKNSDGGFYLTLKIDSDFKIGNKFKKNTILAYDKSSFSDVVGGDSDNIAYNIGTLAKIAILNTDEGYEDSTIISEWLSDAMSSEVVTKVEVKLPKDANIYNMVKIGQEIQEGDSLLVFQNAFDEGDVNLLLKNLVDDESEISDLGRIPIKSKITGVVQDIVIYRTVEKDELSETLKKKVSELEKETNNIEKILKSHNIKNVQIEKPNYKLEKTGKLKNMEDGVLIEFYLKYDDMLSIGDKIINYSALKGVVKDIFEEGKEPYTDFRKDEKIHSLLSYGSVNGRMVGSILLVGGINKVLLELDRKVKDIVGIPWTYLDE